MENDRQLHPVEGVETPPDAHYDENNIQVLEGLEAVRRRPGMYIGSTDYRGLHHLVYEVVDNAIDEAMAGFCDHIEVTLHKDGSVTVTDNGRGIPTGIHPKMGRPTVEVCLTVLHAGGKFGGGGYKVSGGLHGVGVTVVNALSRWLEVWVHQNGKIYHQRYEKGDICFDLEVIGETDHTGTTITFLPDDTIFETLEMDFDTLKNRLRELAFLNGGITIVLADEREGKETRREFYYEGGITHFVQYLNRAKEPLFPQPISLFKEVDGSRVEVALQYTDGYTESVFTYANNIPTHEGGTHLVGFRSALTRALNEYARKIGLLKESDANLSGEDMREGLTAIISVKLEEPQFEGQTKTKLGNSFMRSMVDSIVYDGVSTFLEENPSVGRIIVDKCLGAARAREAARKARCYDFVMALPDGFDTVIGEGGASLSGGERQRISIARCILKDAPIVILDEATASVDADNESYIQQAISELVQGKTLLVIAHRLNTIRGADQILVISDGEIAQRGTHQSLMEEGGIYRNFVTVRQQSRGWNRKAGA